MNGSGLLALSGERQMQVDAVPARSFSLAKNGQASLDVAVLGRVK